MGIISAYYLGFQASQWFLRTRTQKNILLLRSFVTLIIALLPIIKTMALYSLDRKTVTSHGEVKTCFQKEIINIFVQLQTKPIIKGVHAKYTVSDLLLSFFHD